MGIARNAAKSVGKRAPGMAPGTTTSVVREIVKRAIDGVGPLPPAVATAEKKLAKNNGAVDGAIHDIIEKHVRMAGVQGFVTNLGGLTTVAVTIPANISGLAILQCRMIAAIAHLRGFDLSDPRVRNAILACMLGENGVRDAVKKKEIPARPLALATAPATDPNVDRLIAAAVTTELMTRVAGKKVVTSVGRRIPVMGGFVGAGADGFATWKVGRFADRELIQRR